MRACDRKARLRTALLAGAILFVLPLPARAGGGLPSPVALEKVDFERHVMPLLAQQGCSAGSCHGSFQGKGGFRLSLFGYAPEKDYLALTREARGRRIDLADPDRSLILRKPTARVSHGGGRRFAPGSAQYRVFRAWIAAGARWKKGSGAVARMTVTPSEYALIQPGQEGRVRIRVRFKDGAEEDVTGLCEFRVQDDAVAEVRAPGVVRARRPGDTALIVTYRGNVRALRVLVPTPAAHGFRYPRVHEVNYIDREVFAKLRKLNVVPSGLSSDAEFLRRVTIDTIGSLPSPDEVRAFLADRSPSKRDRKIESLLAHPLHAALWAIKFSDITGNNTAALRAPKGTAQARFSQMWHDWFRKRVADNVPYDQIVRGVLTATSREGRSREEWLKEVREMDKDQPKHFADPGAYARRKTLDLFWKVGRGTTLEQLGERTAAAFLGVRLECAQCHKHPFDRWTQEDYRAFANVFGHVVVGMAPDTYEALTGVKLGVKQPAKKGAKKGSKKPPKKKIGLPKGSGLLNEVFVGGKGRNLPPPDFVPVAKKVLFNAKKKKRVVLMYPPPRLPARALGGPAIPLEKGKDARVALFEWMRSADNPYFARSFVNRVWAHYFGVGLVDPVDNFSQANPPSNARLLDALARDFVAHEYDIRHLERTILRSRVYQLSSAMNETNKLDRYNYSHSYVRPLMAEVVLDILADATGVPADFSRDAPAGSRAIEVGSVRILNPDLAHALRTFGRPERSLTCDCERSPEPSLAQTLYRMADPALLYKLGAARFKGKGPPAKGKGKKGVPAKGKGKKPAPAKVKGKKQAPAKVKGKNEPPTRVNVKGQAIQVKVKKPVPPGVKGKKQAPAAGKLGKGVPAKGKGKKAAPPKGKGKKLAPAKGKGKKAVPPKGKRKKQPAKGKQKGAPKLVVQGRLAKLLASGKSDAEILEELFLATLSRFPSAGEKEHFAECRAARRPKQDRAGQVNARREREELFTDVLWALLNTREFIVNH
jgi:hypothetical protein